jgi:hypothetical protein
MELPFTDIEKQARKQVVNDDRLIERWVGRYWKWEFAESGAIIRLRAGLTDIFYACPSVGIFKKVVVDETKFPIFSKCNEDGTCDFIIICQIYDPSKRPDHLVASGYEYCDGDQDELPRKIEWIKTRSLRDAPRLI